MERNRPLLERGQYRITFLIQKLSNVIALVLMMIILGVMNEYFFSAYNLLNIGRQVSIIAIIAVGMTYVIITAGIDLSVGSVMALSSCLAAGAMRVSGSGISGILVGLATGLACGLFNGICVGLMKISPFVTTLAMMAISRGLALVYTQGHPITGLPMDFRWIGVGYIGSIPFPIILAVVILIIGHLILRHTRYGMYVYGLGGNERASYLSGINISVVKIITYSIAGLLAAVGGLVLTARLDSGQPTLGSGYELEAIASAVIGGTSLAGGQGSIGGTIIGALIMGVLNNGLNLLNVSSFWQQTARGIVILLAVSIDMLRRKDFKLIKLN